MSWAVWKLSSGTSSTSKRETTPLITSLSGNESSRLHISLHRRCTQPIWNLNGGKRGSINAGDADLVSSESDRAENSSEIQTIQHCLKKRRESLDMSPLEHQLQVTDTESTVSVSPSSVHTVNNGDHVEDVDGSQDSVIVLYHREAERIDEDVQHEDRDSSSDDLDANIKKVVRYIWDDDEPEDEVICRRFNIPLTRYDLKTLKGTNWLNDQVIDFYLNLIVDRSKSRDDLPRTYAFNTFFLRTLPSRGYSSVRRWTSKVDIFSYDLLLIPLSLSDSHWCLVVVNMDAKTICYFDSMGGKNYTCLKQIRSYLNAEHKNKKKQSLDLSDWILLCQEDIPHQTNECDCGVFTCRFAELSSRRLNFSFSPEEMGSYRKQMVYEICIGRLIV